MMKNLLKYRNLGTPNFFFFLISEIIKRGKESGLSQDKIKQITFNKKIDGRSVYDGCIPLALEIGILYEKDNLLLIDNLLLKNINNNKFKENIAERIIQYMINEDELNSIFKKNAFHYDVVNKLIVVNKNVFSLKHSNYKQLLIDFEVLLIHSDIHIQGYVLNKKYKSFFEKLFPVVNTNRRNISVEEFKQSLERNERYGMEAEEFVFNFELKRLNQVKEIEWISRYIVNAGYDIVSYNHENDSNHNRFIEVKSYSGGNPSFYWSKNELKESKRRLSNYWIYLVDRTKILEEDYDPIMINNPFNTIFKNENWSKSIENYKIQQV